MNEAWSLPAPGIPIGGFSVEALFSKKLLEPEEALYKASFFYYIIN